MAMSSGKTSSMAALMLVVAVVAGTCASGAQAQFDITNNCSSPIDLLTTRNGPNAVSHKLIPNQSLHVNVIPSRFLLLPFKIAYDPVTSPQASSLYPGILELYRLGKGLKKFEISCGQFGFMLSVTYQCQRQGSPRKTFQRGPFCPPK